jgi:uncharacterized protein DUF1905/bacteriocin resistance YdeI/OmpD-like protein
MTAITRSAKLHQGGAAMAADTQGAITFRATILLGGKTATGIHVPDDVVAALGAGRRPRVRATLGGHTYRTSVAPMRGRYMLPISSEVRAAARVAAGDEVDVALQIDSEPREVAVPPDLAAALGVEARRFFDGLSYTNQQRVVLSVESAKTAETRERRIAKAVADLGQGRKL